MNAHIPIIVEFRIDSHNTNYKITHKYLSKLSVYNNIIQSKYLLFFKKKKKNLQMKKKFIFVTFKRNFSLFASESKVQSSRHAQLNICLSEIVQHFFSSLYISGASRRRCLSILKTLRDRHLDMPGNPVSSYHMKTLLLYECEKHPREMEWEDNCLADRINGIFMQLISCLQCRRCPHYFLPNMDLFKGKSPGSLENAAKTVWRLLRIMLTNTRCLEEL